MRGPARLATYIAVAMTVAGFGTIFLAWNGAASIDRPTGQFPYLISGGLVGLGLIIGAMAVLYLQTARQLTAERAYRMAEVNKTMASVVEAAGKGTFVPEGAGAPSAAGGRSTKRSSAPKGSTTSAPEGPWAPNQVVAGKTSFHAPSCHLVASRDDLDQIAREDAMAAGLNPCRICKP